jgi:plastocyanin
MFIVLGVLALVAVLGVVAVLRAWVPADRVPGRGEAPTRIVMDGTRFHPEEATVDSGAVVLWANLDPFPHNVNSESGNFHSDNLAPDGTWVFRPTERGTFEYHCTLHPGMKAVLRVR